MYTKDELQRLLIGILTTQKEYKKDSINWWMAEATVVLLTQMLSKI